MAENASFVGGILNYLGLTGSGAPTSSLIPRPKPLPGQDSALTKDFNDTGQVADPNAWSRFDTIMQRPTDMESMYKLWEEMAVWDLLAAALVEVVDEACQYDDSCPGSIWYECNNQDVEDNLNEMLKTIKAEEKLPSQVYYVSALGNCFEKLDYEPGVGVVGTTAVHPLEMRRYWLKRNRECIGFRWAGNKPDRDPVFKLANDKEPIQRVAMTDNKNIEDLYYPWDFLHFRRIYRQRMSEHGEPIFNEAQGIYKKLKLAVDQMVVHRAQVQPDRYRIDIDVGSQPPTEQLKTVNRWKQAMRAKLSFGQGDGAGNPTAFESFYNPLSLDTILYVAKPKDTNHTIDKIPGTANVPDVYDIELLVNLFFSIIGMPKWWIGAAEAQQPASGKALLATDMRFLRKIKQIRRPIVQGYEWLGYFHCLLKGHNVKDLEIQAKMSPIGGLEDQMKLELLGLQADILERLGSVMEQYNLPRDAWLDLIFKRFLHLPDEVVNVFLTALPPEQAQVELESKTSAPRTHVLIRQIDEALNDKTGKQLKETMKRLARTSSCARRLK